MMSFEAVHKRSAPAMVADQILKQIEAGDLAPGARLPAQRDLARLLGVGRSSIREAVNALVAMGYLEAQHGRGTFVCQCLPSDSLPENRLESALQAGSIFDLLEARELLECQSALLAAKQADSFYIRKMEDAIRQLKNAPTDNYPAFLKADFDVHLTLAEATGNAVICEMTRLVLEKAAEHHTRLRTENLSESYRAESIQTAEQLVKSVCRGKGKQAADWMRRHLKAISEELRNVL